ncbi:zinc-binding alcohol dehydrogenase/oxidoreductase [Scopulibacillus darangshiensis]|uniref:Zinc-binding alcohol dehydrogenase/oxidoreductase n=1 Tax=Scopulibacillus darangshiensis TaxID=442528 RepID=A0A4R2NT34_9BACL|nr:zinc-binding dehydrogenase [Scopulibacillus darangshiensis]TCP24565.1 zinc-binding alcohol dehydrogenase/oxidoreductase [Scopulibacillus darangshiensis]
MKAIVHKGTAGFQGVSYTDIEASSVSDGKVKVSLKSAGLNHRDLFVLTRHKEDEPGLIIGSDGAGVITEIGQDVEGLTVGDEVVIIPSLGWKDKTPAPPEHFEILGLPDHGTFAEEIVIDAGQIARKPGYLTWEEAGVLPLGALTAYRALFTRGQLKVGQTVFIPGAGSGVATYLIQMAKASDAKVIVSSRSEEKRQKALEVGADLAIDSNEDWASELKGEMVDLVIESVGAATLRKSFHVLKQGGTLVLFGASAGDEVTMNLRDFFYGQYSFLGSTMGSIQEFHEMISLIEKHQIKPVVDSVYPLEEALAAMKRLEDGEQFGKIALKVTD